MPGPSGQPSEQPSQAGPALLVLEDGRTFRGEPFGAAGETFGEMVFNTGMTGYQETLTDPSYCRQIVAMTAPHIGNTGVNEEDPESRQAWVSGYVVREPARLASSWRATAGLDAYLKAEGVTGIAVRGTRLLTRRVREQGAMRAAISTVETSPEKLLERVLASPEMTGDTANGRSMSVTRADRPGKSNFPIAHAAPSPNAMFTGTATATTTSVSRRADRVSGSVTRCT